MESLEQRARAEWDSIQVKGVARSKPMHEYVALGIVEPSGRADNEDTIVWYELENTAEANPDGRGEFFVDGMDLYEVLVQAASDLGHLQMGMQDRQCVDAMLRERVALLWHTHTATTEPSREDIAEFPSWLADYGMVYHVPTGTTTVYNQGGIISSTNMPVSSALATSKE